MNDFEKAREKFGELLYTQFIEYLKEKHPEMAEDLEKFTVKVVAEDIIMDKVEEPPCPLCVKFARYYDREYDEAYAAYHANHCCQCGHLHDDRKEFCEGGEECGCQTFISQEGLPAIKSKSKEE